MPLYKVQLEESTEIVRLQEEGVDITLDTAVLDADQKDKIRRLLSHLVEDVEDQDP